MAELIESHECELAKRKYAETYARRKDKSQMPQNPLLYVPRNPSRTMDTDLTAAGIEKETSEGVVKFHALRVAYVSHLVASGANPKEVMQLARHSDVNLSMNIYAKAQEHALSGLVSGMERRIPTQRNTTYTQQTSRGRRKRVNRGRKMAEETGLEPASPKAAVFKTAALPIMLLLRSKPENEI